MKELILTHLPEIIIGIVGIISAASAWIISIFNQKKAKAEYQTKLSEEKSKSLALEIQKAELQKAMIEGAFVICPNCKTKIKASELVFYTQEVIGNENEKTS